MSLPHFDLTDTPNSKPTICHVLHTLNVGGAEILARELGTRVADRMRVTFACLDEGGRIAEELRALGFLVEVIQRKPGFDYGCARRLARFVKDNRVSLIHAHQYGPFFYSALSRLNSHKTPIVFMEHGRDYPDYPRPKRKVANRLLLRSSDRVAAVGECVRQALIDNEGMQPSRVEVIYNGIDLNQYDADRPQRDTVRQRLRLSCDDFVVAQVARLNRLKDHATAIRAIASLDPAIPVKLLLVGDGEERAALEALIKELQVASRVELLGTRSDVAELLQAADAFLLSSVSEGIPLTLIEAMATGLPCLATRVGGNSEVVVDGETGFLVPAQHPRDIAEKLTVLSRLPELCRRLGDSGRKRAELTFSDTKMHGAYQQIYRQLLQLDSHYKGSRNLHQQDPELSEELPINA